jgi:hypothetical protein
MSSIVNVLDTTDTTQRELEHELRWMAAHVLTPIATGTTIYLCWRCDTLRVFGWLQALGLDSEVRFARLATTSLRPPDWVRFSVPDALFAYVCFACCLRVWNDRRAPIGRTAWLLVAFGLTTGAEVLQAFGLLRGTFDPIDLLLTICATALAFTLNDRNRR